MLNEAGSFRPLANSFKTMSATECDAWISSKFMRSLESQLLIFLWFYLRLKLTPSPLKEENIVCVCKIANAEQNASVDACGRLTFNKISFTPLNVKCDVLPLMSFRSLPQNF
jgi:hypothetical protein